MKIEEIKVRLDNLQNGKTIKKFETMDFATQYVMDYNLDVTYLLSIIEHYQAGFEVLSDIPMSMHPSEIKNFSKQMLKGEKPYIL